MSVNRAEHQRSILAAMGVDVWVAQAEFQPHCYTNHLYRDSEIPDESLSQIVDFQSMVISAQTTSPGSSTSQLHQPIVALQSQTDFKQKTDLDSIQPQQPKETAQQAHPSVEDSSPALYVEPFRIQAFCMQHCLCVLDALTLTAEQQQLWNNIQQSVTGQLYELNWPFALPGFQDGRGAESYVQGFLDAHGLDRHILSLGHVQHLTSGQVLILASLEEMLQQPQLKRRLWQLMQGSNPHQH